MHKRQIYDKIADIMGFPLKELLVASIALSTGCAVNNSSGNNTVNTPVDRTPLATSLPTALPTRIPTSLPVPSPTRLPSATVGLVRPDRTPTTVGKSLFSDPFHTEKNERTMYSVVDSYVKKFGGNSQNIKRGLVFADQQPADRIGTPTIVSFDTETLNRQLIILPQAYSIDKESKFYRDIYFLDVENRGSLTRNASFMSVLRQLGDIPSSAVIDSAGFAMYIKVPAIGPNDENITIYYPMDNLDRGIGNVFAVNVDPQIFNELQPEERVEVDFIKKISSKQGASFNNWILPLHRKTDYPISVMDLFTAPNESMLEKVKGFIIMDGIMLDIYSGKISSAYEAYVRWRFEFKGDRVGYNIDLHKVLRPDGQIVYAFNPGG